MKKDVQISKKQNFFSETTFQQIEDKVEYAIEKILQKDLAERRKQALLLSPNGCTMSFDARWSHRRNARESTTSAIDLHTKKIVEVEHIEMCEKMHSELEKKNCKEDEFEEITLDINGETVKYKRRKRNFHGTSKSMEGIAVGEICRRLKSENFIIARLVHDNDASTVLHVKEHFPNCQESLDNNHARKNMTGSLMEIKKEFANLKKEMKNQKIDIGKELDIPEIERISKNFRNAALNSPGQPELFQRRFLNYFFHCFNKCNQYCMHNLPQVLYQQFV